jgi:phasin family protein
MQSDLFTNLFSQSQPLLDTLVKANKLAIAEFEKLAALQTSTLSSYVDLCLAQLKAVSEIKDPQGVQNFYSEQLKALSTLSNKLIEDSQTLAQLGVDIRNDFSKLVEESLADVVPKAAKAEVREAA